MENLILTHEYLYGLLTYPSQSLKQRYDPKIIREYEVSDYKMMKSFVWNVN